MMPPALWRDFTERYLELDADLAQVWWTALDTSQWTKPRAFLKTVLDQNNMVHARQEEGTPRVGGPTDAPTVVAALEALVHEGRLARSQAPAIEEHIFAALTATGQWRD